MKRIFAICLGAVLLLSACSAKAGKIQTHNVPTKTSAQTVEADETPEITLLDSAPGQSLEDMLVLTGGDGQGKVSYKVGYTDVKTFSDSYGDTYAQVLLEVKNTGKDPLYFGDASCELEDRRGNFVDALSRIECYPVIVQPGEKGTYYTVAQIDVEEPLPLKLSYELEDVQIATIPPVQYRLSGFEIDPERWTATGTVENTSGQTQTSHRVAVILYNQAERPLAVLETSLSHHAASGEKLDFEVDADILPTDGSLKAVRKCKVYAYPPHVQ